MIDNDELAALILPWAKAEHPEKYEKTIEQSQRPDTYRKFLVRLIEIRASDDRLWRNALPLSILNETALSVTIKLRKTGQVLIVGGNGMRACNVNFRMLEMCLAEGAGEQTLQSMLDVNDRFDLEIVP